MPGSIRAAPTSPSPASVLLDTILRRLGAETSRCATSRCARGWSSTTSSATARTIRKVERYPDVRRRSVIELGERCGYWSEHAQQVAAARAVASSTRPAASTGWPIASASGSSTRALLHDVGVHISYERHHRHSYYLIKNGDLRGFDPAGDRGHRAHRALSSTGDAEEGPRRLRRSARERCGSTVRTLAAMLRLAEGLDRSHAQASPGSTSYPRGDDYLVRLRATGDAELELWAAHRHVAPLERVLGKPIRFEVGRQATHEGHEAAYMLNNLTTPHEYPGKAVRRRGHRRVGKDHPARAAGKVA